MDLSTCPFCNLTVPSLELERHANDHFEDEDLARDVELAQEIALASPSLPLVVVNNPMATENIFLERPERDSSRCDASTSGGEGSDIDEKIRSLVSLQVRETFYEVKDGLMVLLQKCVELDSNSSTSILSGHIDHFQSIESEDVGWGCGWRNIQMLSSYLLKQRQEARDVLFGGSGFVPDITSLQRWLEIAWERGFDTLGSIDFDHEIYGKRNWIGTTECATLLRSFGLRARIVTFCSKELQSLLSAPCLSHGARGIGTNTGEENPTQVFGPMDIFLSKGNLSTLQASSSGNEKSNHHSTHIRQVKGHQALMDWVWNYFSDNKLNSLHKHRVIVSEKMPLYFQHDGHSRTIVGIQVKHQQSGIQQYNLLILDPAQKTKSLEISLKNNAGWQKLIKRGVHTLKKPHYQLCYVDPGIAFGEEMEKLKTIDSTYVELEVGSSSSSASCANPGVYVPYT